MSGGRAGRALTTAGLVAALGGGLAILAAGPGTRFGLWHFRTAFSLMRWGAYAALAGVALGLVGLLARGPRLAAALAVVAGAGSFLGPWTWQRTARTVPAIHDISTDTDDPPAFVDVLSRRAAAAATNRSDYGGAEVAAQQHRAYPDVQPLRLAAAPAEAFARALQAARAMGWEIVGAVPDQGRIEATDTTFWFGFKDDVVVRVRPDGQGSRVDVRSLSRVGRSDVGANARRIRRYLERLRSAG